MTLTRITSNDDDNLREQCPRCDYWELMASQIYDSGQGTEIAGWNCTNCHAQFTGSP